MITQASSFFICLLIMGFFIQPLSAQEENPNHDQLRQLREEIITSIKEGKIDGILKHIHPDAVITWQNNEVCRGHAGLKDFYSDMMSGDDNKFEGYIKPPTADKLTRLYADDTVGLVEGETVARYTLLGKEIQLPSRWTASLLKSEDGWKLASYHISMNVLDNPILNGFRNSGLLFGGLGFLLGCLKKRKKKA